MTEKILKLMYYTQGNNASNTTMEFVMPIFVVIEKVDNLNEELEPGQYMINVTILLSLPYNYQIDKKNPGKILEASKID